MRSVRKRPYLLDTGLRFAAFVFVAALCGYGFAGGEARAEKPRLLVLTDIGGDPDDQQSMVRLMTYANEFEIEGIIVTDQKPLRVDLVREIVDAYGQVRDNLSLHADGFPTRTHLRSVIKNGQPGWQGIKGVGEGKDTEGSNWVISVVDREDPRPINISIWGGQSELAQALWKVREERTPEELAAFVRKIRVHDIADQDRLQKWFAQNFPKLFYIVDNGHGNKWNAVFRGMYQEGDNALRDAKWVANHVTGSQGPLGGLYPPKAASGVKEGDTPSYFYFLPLQFQDPQHPSWGGWGGRFELKKDNTYWDAVDRYAGKASYKSTVARWRPAFQNDFAARMDWCVKPYDKANHPPQVVLAHKAKVKVKKGRTVRLSAKGTKDPDGDKPTYKWWQYREPGTYRGKVNIQNSDRQQASFRVPGDATKGQTIHIICEVTDDGTPPLTRYGRVIVQLSQ